MSSRDPSDIGHSTNGMTLPEPDQLDYPLRVEKVHVQVGDYVDEKTYVYVIIDRSGVPFAFQPDKPGQITKVLIAEGDILNSPQRLFELCCDEQAQIFSAGRAIKTEFAKSVRPKAQEDTSNPPALSIAKHEAAPTAVATPARSGARLGAFGVVAGITLLVGVIVGATGVFDGLYTRFNIWMDPNNYGYESYADYLEQKTNPAAIPDHFSEGASNWRGIEYAGELKNYKPHGQGKLALAGYEEYFGTWIDGERQPEGYTKILFRDARREGTFNDDLLLHGNGTQVFDNGARYTGQFKAGVPHGRGTYTFAEGTTYEGDLLDGNRHGKGTLTFPSGDTYEGDFKENERTGQGVYTFKNGSRYSGGYLNGKWHGQGTIQHADGSSYQGGFASGVRHGKGTLTFAGGEIYAGDFLNGARTGQAKLTYPDGAYYEGTFLQGRANGRGVFRNAAGDITTGEFNNGLANGNGTIEYANGDSYTGNFKDFRREGMSKFEKAAEIRLKAEHDRWAWVARMRQRHDERKEARRRMNRAGNRNAAGQSLEDDQSAPGRIFWAYMHPGDLPEEVGQAIPCPGGYVGQAECSVVRKEKVWRLHKGCGLNGRGRSNAEAADPERIVVFEARGDLKNVRESVKSQVERGNNGDTPPHLRTRMSEGLLTSFLVDDIWNDLLDFKAPVNQSTYEATGVRATRVFFRTYTSLATYTLTSGCYVDINIGEGPTRMR